MASDWTIYALAGRIDDHPSPWRRIRVSPAPDWRDISARLERRIQTEALGGLDGWPHPLSEKSPAQGRGPARTVCSFPCRGPSSRLLHLSWMVRFNISALAALLKEATVLWARQLLLPPCRYGTLGAYTSRADAHLRNLNSTGLRYINATNMHTIGVGPALVEMLRFLKPEGVREEATTCG